MGEPMAEINVDMLNEAAKSSEKMILTAERDYHNHIKELTRKITEDGAVRIVLLAGPSGSGKTTTANLLSDSIKGEGEDSMVVSLDNFYRDATDPDYPRLVDGTLDYECPDALDIPLLTETLERIANGKDFCIPKYDFKEGKCVDTTFYEPMPHGCVIIEGLHALNPIIYKNLPSEKILRLFVSVSTNVNYRGERIISGRKIRFVRRLVRDSIYRGADTKKTLSMWHNVLVAEDIYLYPYKQLADAAFDTFHTFELGAMKPYAEKLLTDDITASDSYAMTVKRALDSVVEIDDKLVPENSLIKEFLPGGVYEHLY